MKTKNLPAMKVPHLQVGDTTLYFTNVKGRWMIPLKPICDALGVAWERQFRTVKASPILGQLLSQETIVAGDRKPRMMVCLPEMFVYGWLLRIDTTKPEVIAFQLKCYVALWEHFHGKTLAEVENADQIVRLEQRLNLVEQELVQDAKFKEWQEVKAELREAKNAPAKRTKLLVEERRQQLGLFDAPTE